MRPTSRCHARGRRRPHAGDLRDAAHTDRQHVSDDTSDIRLRAGLVATQILGLALCRYVLNFPLVAAMSRHSHNMVTGTRATAAAGLACWAHDTDAPPPRRQCELDTTGDGPEEPGSP